MTSHAPLPLPPVVQYPSSTQRLTHAAAHSLLSSFLERAALEPEFAPASVLSERGPVVRDAGGKGGLVGRGLERVLKGMSGERVGGKLEEEDVDESGTVGQEGVGDGGDGKEKKRKRDMADTEELDRERWEMDLSTAQASDAGGEPVLRPSHAETGAGGDVSQDRDDYDLMQDDEDGEEVDVMNSARHTGAEAVLEEDEEEKVELPKETQEKKRKVDKAERKRLKAERRKAEKKTARTS